MAELGFGEALGQILRDLGQSWGDLVNIWVRLGFLVKTWGRVGFWCTSGAESGGFDEDVGQILGVLVKIWGKVGFW